jgi:hypothetical protein
MPAGKADRCNPDRCKQIGDRWANMAGFYCSEDQNSLVYCDANQKEQVFKSVLCKDSCQVNPKGVADVCVGGVADQIPTNLYNKIGSDSGPTLADTNYCTQIPIEKWHNLGYYCIDNTKLIQCDPQYKMLSQRDCATGCQQPANSSNAKCAEDVSLSGASQVNCGTLDTNLDGVINYKDFYVLVKLYSTSGSTKLCTDDYTDETGFGPMDTNGDRIINYIDFAQLIKNYQR